MPSPQNAPVTRRGPYAHTASSAEQGSFGRETYVFAPAEAFLQSGHIAEAACLISDVRMPGMSGVEMHDRLLELGCAPPTIFVTAFPIAALRAKFLANGALTFLHKPVDATAVAHWLNLALGSP